MSKERQRRLITGVSDPNEAGNIIGGGGRSRRGKAHGRRNQETKKHMKKNGGRTSKQRKRGMGYIPQDDCPRAGPAKQAE